MIHTLCDECGKMTPLDFMVRIDDDFYCIECEPRKEKGIEPVTPEDLIISIDDIEPRTVRGCVKGNFKKKGSK